MIETASATEHHSFVLFDKRVREALDTHRRFAPGVTIKQMSWTCGSLKEIVHGNDWIAAQGLPIHRGPEAFDAEPDTYAGEVFLGPLG